MLYADNGSTNITVVDGSTDTGIYSDSGAYNVVYAPDPVTENVGRNHPCGAMWVTVADEGVPAGLYAPDGSVYISETSAKTGAMFVTIT